MTTERWLIDAKPLMKNGWHLVQTGESNRFLRSMSLADVPPVDAVEVVRCKDCRRWNFVTKPRECDKLQGYCLNDDELVKRWEYDFCSYGKRRDNG